MANTYYDSQLTAEEIEQVLEAISGILTSANNGKVLAISDGTIEARSVQWGGGSTVLEPLSVTANGDYTPEAGVDGFYEVHVSVPNSYSASDEGKVVNNGALVAQTARASQITQNGTYDTTQNNEVTVNVSGGGSAVVQPLSVTQNGTYNPPSGVDGYAPVTVNVSGGGSGNTYEGYSTPSSDIGVVGDFYLQKMPPFAASNGNAYVDTGLLAAGDIEFEITFYTKNSVSGSGYGTIFGGRNSSRNNEFQLSTYNATTGGMFGYKTTRYNPKITPKELQTISFKNGTLTCNDGTTVTIEPSTWESVSTINLFGNHNGSSNAESSITGIKSAKFWKAGTLTRDYSGKVVNGVVGMYDAVNDTFTAPVSGTLIYTDESIYKVYKKTSTGWEVYLDYNSWIAS